MVELLKTVRLVGLRPIITLFRAYRHGWQGAISGYFTTRTMQTLFNVGFFDAMQEQGAIDVAAFAAENGLDGSILQSLCDALYAQRILDKNGSGYVLDSKGQVLVESGRGWFDGIYSYENAYHQLEDMLQKELVYGRDIERRHAHIAKGSEHMENQLYFPLAIDIVKRNGYQHVLDLGCGHGTFLRRLCTESGVAGYGIDMAPSVLQQARLLAQQDGLQNKIHFHDGNMNALDQLPNLYQDIDVATAFFVLHEILYSGVDQVVGFLQAFRTHFPGVPLIIFEVIRATPEEMRQRPGMAIYYTLQHDLTHQTLIGRAEWMEIFSQAGIQSIEERYLRFARTSIFTLH